MAITFLEKRKKLRELIPVVVAAILISAFILWRGFFVKGEPQLPGELLEKPAKKIEINFQVLKHPIFKKLQLFEKIPVFEQDLGRENPFLPY